MICMDNEPFALVNRPGFVKLMAHVAPYYVLPNPQYFADLLPQEYARCKDAVLAELQTAQDICFTTDLWTAKNSTQSHMALTGKV